MKTEGGPSLSGGRQRTDLSCPLQNPDLVAKEQDLGLLSGSEPDEEQDEHDSTVGVDGGQEHGSTAIPPARDHWRRPVPNTDGVCALHTSPQRGGEEVWTPTMAFANLTPSQSGI